MNEPLASVPGLPDELLARAAGRLCLLEPDAIALLVTGSYARGAADTASDLDLTVIARRPAGPPYRTFVEHRDDGSALLVTVATKTPRRWMARRKEPATWSLGLPALEDARYAWASAEARETIGEPPSVLHPAAPPELVDFVEAMAKTQRAIARRDVPGMRWHARDAAELAPGLLLPFNSPGPVRDRRSALAVAAALAAAPVNYAHDLVATLGVTSAGDEEVATSAFRLARELLAFLRERAAAFEDDPEVGGLLADGTLQRHLGLG